MANRFTVSLSQRVKVSAVGVFLVSIIAIALLDMPFRQHLNHLLDKAEQMMGDRPPRVPLHSKPPPPIPFSNRPIPPPYHEHLRPPQAYWQPDFSPSVPVNANFRHETGQHGWGNNEAQNYVDDRTNSFHGPNNSIWLRAIVDSTAPTNDRKYTSARLTSHHTLSRPRGCLSVHIHAPVARGVWPAFWLLPQDPFSWPGDGEVDIFEAWNGDPINHSCLHWGHYNGEDWDKHRVIETPLHSVTQQGHQFDFVWDEDESTGHGRMVWYIDQKPVMKASKPAGTRKLRDFRILINIAMGGTVCQGQIPADGQYDMMVSRLAMLEYGPGNWQAFDRDWVTTREGHPV